MWDFTQLEVWKRARALAVEIYRLTENFPVDERFGMVAQLRRAANSVGANIAEGSGRFGGRDRARFFEVAVGSISELEHHLTLSADLTLVEPEEFMRLRLEIDEIRRMIKALRTHSLGQV